MLRTKISEINEAIHYDKEKTIYKYANINNKNHKKKRLVYCQYKQQSHYFLNLYQVKVPMKRKFLFDIFADKGLKFRFLLLELNIAPFNNSKISVKHDKSDATNSTVSDICK